ncbi:hypothetical protein RVBP16_1920 [Pseudomonas phage sp. 30-2]|nr:PhoH-like phosphate starvation-inducible [Pseudomonas phage Deifobo]BDR25752.1 hypothetical protein RVBP16_1920 [Pseudomonas phage sp. 30-2]
MKQRDKRKARASEGPNSTFHLVTNNVVQPSTNTKQVRSIQRKQEVKLIPKSLAQEEYVNALEDDTQHIVFATGPAGSGKTLLASMYAIKAYKEGKCDKIVITRPAVSVDEEHGFLPGTLIDKMAPWVIPIMDVFKEYYSPVEIEQMLMEEIIEIAPLAYMRGRTFKNCVILADEIQNTTPNMSKMLFSRIGENCKMIVTGDIEQHDRGFEINGLKDFLERLDKAGGNKHISVIKFTSKDIKRHPLIEDILEMYKDIN